MTVRLAGPPEGCGLPRVDRTRLTQRAGRVLDALGRPEAELSISLVEDAEIAELNRRYRGRDAATDVLSFSLLEGDHASHRGALLGDVVIGIRVAERQALERGHSLAEEIERLLVHGVLHLLGHDHEEPDEARVMRTEEERLREAIAR